jgi:hypothetical protein
MSKKEVKKEVKKEIKKEEKKETNKESNIEENKKVIYLKRDKKEPIKYQITKEVTCNSILSDLKSKLTEKINEFYKKKIEDCNFIVIEDKTQAKKEEIPSLIELRLNNKSNIYEILKNNQYFLYFLPKRSSNLFERNNARNGNCQENFFEDAEANYFSNKTTEEYLTKSVIYLYDTKKCTFSKEKGTVDKNKITIFKGKNPIEIFIKDIKIEENNDNIKKLKIAGDRPKFFLQIKTNKDEYIFGQYKETYFRQWESAINLSITKYNNYNVELNLNMTINSNKTGLFAIHHSILNNCFILNKILFNEQIRKIFFSNFREKPEKKGAIVYYILSYKGLIYKGQYLEAWMKFKEILTYIDSYQITYPKDDDINIIFNQERIQKYMQISEASNEGIKILKTDQPLDVLQNSFKTALSAVLKKDLFDDVFHSLYEKYVVPYFENIFIKELEKEYSPTTKPEIRQKFQYLLAIYFFNIYNVSSNNFDAFMTKKTNQTDEKIVNNISNQTI